MGIRFAAFTYMEAIRKTYRLRLKGEQTIPFPPKNIRKRKRNQNGEQVMKTVDELVSTWTEEEKETFNDLIAESRQRERALIEMSRVSQENLIKLMESQMALLAQTSELKKALESLADSLLRIYLRLYNQKLPSS